MEKLTYDKLTIYEVEDLYKKLLTSYKDKKEIILDFENIKKIDMTAIQLLLSTQKTAQEKSIPFSLINLSDDLKHTFKSCGCDTILGISHD